MCLITLNKSLLLSILDRSSSTLTFTCYTTSCLNLSFESYLKRKCALLEGLGDFTERAGFGYQCGVWYLSYDSESLVNAVLFKKLEVRNGCFLWRLELLMKTYFLITRKFFAIVFGLIFILLFVAIGSLISSF